MLGLKKFLILLFISLAIFSGCTTKGFVKNEDLNVIQYTIQAGAFSNIDNVENFMNKLAAKGLEPYYFKDDNGLYKVRFGNFYTYQAAQYTAEKLKNDGTLEDFIIVTPDIKRDLKNYEYTDEMREKIIKTALNYLGTPYVRGGNDPDGFDCSGFVQTVFRMNGIELPRTSAEQFKKGENSNNLQKGDLVFFKINGKTVSHVGIYIGDGKFIHAPRVRSNVRIENLDLPYYKKRYVGAKTYLTSQNAVARN